VSGELGHLLAEGGVGGGPALAATVMFIAGAVMHDL
jgi:hypothetical protein